MGWVNKDRIMCAREEAGGADMDGSFEFGALKGHPGGMTKDIWGQRHRGMPKGKLLVFLDSFFEEIVTEPL